MQQILCEDIWAMYRIKFIIGGKPKPENFWAIKGINFGVLPGETVGIIGENGAGKSTILKIIAGMIKPDRGNAKVNGKIAGLLELGAGMQPELTGNENIYLIAGLFGLSRTAIESVYNNIVEFAGLGKFINAPVKCYSQGMFVRLAFAIAINMDADILLIDDTLAVGDEYFQKKCVKKVFELKEQGKTIIFVTHDMTMLRRLCKRAIFLKEGKIVKDGPIEQVIPLYLQTSGIKEGVAILEDRPVKLIFNNGRLFINWKDKLISPDSGAYASFFLMGRWYSSFQADWQVSKEGQNSLTAVGTFFQLNCTQTWQISLIEGKIIEIDIEVNSPDQIYIQDACTNFMLSDKYMTWFSDQEKGQFPPITDKDNKWEALLSQEEPKGCVGVKSPSAEFPSFILEQKNISLVNNLQIFNSGYLDRSRVLQYNAKDLQNYTNSAENKVKYFSGRVLLGYEPEEYLAVLGQSGCILDGPVKLKFSQGRCIVYYDSRKLTKANHGLVSIQSGSRIFSSDTADWEVIEKSEKKIIIRGSWKNFPVALIWKIQVTVSSFVWEVELEVLEETQIQRQQMILAFLAEYDSYYSDYGTAQFETKFFESKTDMLKRCITEGAVGMFSSQNSIVPLSVKLKDGLQNFFKVFNSDISDCCREMWISRVEPEDQIYFKPGRHACLFAEMSFTKPESIKNNFGMISSNRLKLALENNHISIFWKERELTKGLGLYTSLRSQGRWYDSNTCAAWQIKQDNSTFFSKVNWLSLPIIQQWEIRLLGENIIELSIRMAVTKEARVDRSQTNLMLSETYQKWLAADKEGEFPDFTSGIDDDWQVLSAAAINKEKEFFLSASAGALEKLPEIKLVPENLIPGWSLNVVNSDLFHRARILQFASIQDRVLFPGEYEYFKGKVLLENRE